MTLHTTRRAVALGLVTSVPAVAGISWMARDTAGFTQAGAAMRVPLDLAATGPARVSELVRYATLAANSHNTQAWRFSGDETRIILTPDASRATPAVDPDNHHTFVSLGAAAETLVIAASAYALIATPQFDPVSGSVAIMLTSGGELSPLLAAVALRQSNRSTYDGTPLTAPERTALQQSVAGSEAVLHLIEDAPRKAALRDMVVAGNDTQMDDPAFVAELRHWLRFSESAAVASADGLFSGCSGNPALPQWAGNAIFPQVFCKPSEAGKYSAQIDSSAALALLVSAGDTPEHWVETGRALTRLTLQAMDLGLAHAHVNQAIEVPGQRAALAQMLGIASGRPSILLRIGRAAPIPYALRRSVTEVLS